LGGDPSPHTHRVYRHEAIQRERPNKEKTSILTRQLPMLSSVSYNLRQAWLFFLKTQQFLVDVSVIDRQGCACVRTLWFRKMSTLLIARTSGSIADSFRPYQVFVDGIRRGCVSVNETLLISVEPGIHSVRFGIDFYSSLPLMVHASEGETSITCRSTTRRLFGYRSQGLRCERRLLRLLFLARTYRRHSSIDIAWRADLVQGGSKCHSRKSSFCLE